MQIPEALKSRFSNEVTAEVERMARKKAEAAGVNHNAPGWLVGAFATSFGDGTFKIAWKAVQDRWEAAGMLPKEAV